MTYYDQVRAEIPEIVALRRAVGLARKAMTTPPARDVESDTEAVEQAHSTVLRGEEVPSDLGARLIAARRADEEADARMIAVRNLHERLEGELVEAEVSNTNKLLTALGQIHEELLTEASSLLTVLGTARTADAVISAGADAIEAWNELDRLAGKYDQLRDAQWTVVRNGWSRFGGSITMTTSGVGLHMVIANSAAIWSGDSQSPPPWPHDRHRAGDMPAADRTFLLWAAANPEHVWLPTIPELLGSMAEQKTQREAASVKQRDPAEVAQERAQLRSKASAGVFLSAQ